jgi:MFS family permease
MIADRFSPRLVFFVCTLAGAFTNFSLLLVPPGLAELLSLRFATGFFLAGIYPVGMKIAAGWYRDDLGRVLGFLIGALVLGTAFPHLLRSLGTTLPWQQVIFGVSLFASVGGAAMLLGVPDGPYIGPGSHFNPRAIGLIFARPRFRASACGYFGHMWELYTLWAFAPLLLLAWAERHSLQLNLSLWTFLFIAAGSLGCVAGGLLSLRKGSARVAAGQLAVSGACCLLAPLLIDSAAGVFFVFMLIWGVTVAGDSPQFSAMNASYAPPEYIGSALTIVNSIGFLLSVVSIQLAGWLLPLVNIQYLFWFILPGPLLGLWALRPLCRPQ